MPTKTEPVAVLHLVFEGLALTLCKKVVPWAFRFQTRVVSAGASPCTFTRSSASAGTRGIYRFPFCSQRGWFLAALPAV